ncbi:MAG: DNA polymerase III subunit beta [Bacteroidetes bacterium]|nr:MAG: DNA polymerase III subunit beta [Bacteroidota bacterium]TAG86425.1 MAG: DNA polymerase III subunit beta [Bacteroidota bacterium]
MKFIISSGVLQKSLSSISGVLISNPVVPILENFLLELDKGRLVASASDLQISMTTSISVDTDVPGKIAIPAKILLDTLKNLPEQPISFSVNIDDSMTEITSYKGTYKLGGELATDFPNIPVATGDNRITVSSDLLLDAISNTLFSVGKDEMRPAMTGVFLKLEKDKLTFVATDANRLVKYVRNDVNNEVEATMIIPKKAMQLLKASLPSNPTEVEIQFSDSNAFFSFNQTTMACRLIDEKYPDYDSAIPLNNDKRLSVSRTELLSSLKRLIIYANKSNYQIRYTMQQDVLTISAEDTDFANEAQEQIIAEYEGRDMEVGFNATFMIDALTNMVGDEIELNFSDPNRACIIVPREKTPEENILMLVMPVMINSTINDSFDGSDEESEDEEEEVNEENEE